MRSWLRCPRLRPQQIARPSRTIRGGGLTTCRGRKSCLHSGSRPKWPAWRNRRRVPVRPIQAKAKLWSIALVDRGWSGRFRPQGRLPVYFEASRPASATRIGRDRVPDSGWNHFGLSPGPWVASESGFDLFDLPPRPLERTTLVDGADHVLAASRACVCAHGCAAPGYASSKSPDSRAPSEAVG